jgi:predicted N-formylglutamate amidohydrolase
MPLRQKAQGIMTYTPFWIEGEQRRSRFLVTCDHATNTVPPDLGGTLGLTQADMARHIAYDVGARGVALALGAALGCPVIGTDYSRLVIDPNRGEDDPTLLMRIYDGSVVPGNRHADDAETERRLDAYYRPYHAALARLAARRDDTVLVSVHSFTRQLRNRPARPWHVGILHAWDRRLSDPLIDLLAQEPDLVVGRNEPYPGHLPGDAIDRHALHHGRVNTLIELRNDLVEEARAQAHWGERLAPLLERALAEVKE